MYAEGYVAAVLCTHCGPIIILLSSVSDEKKKKNISEQLFKTSSAH